MLFQNAPHTNLCAHIHFYVVTSKSQKITILCGHIQNFMWPHTKFYVVKKLETQGFLTFLTTYRILCGHIQNFMWSFVCYSCSHKVRFHAGNFELSQTIYVKNGFKKTTTYNFYATT